MREEHYPDNSLWARGPVEILQGQVFRTGKWKYYTRDERLLAEGYFDRSLSSAADRYGTIPVHGRTGTWTFFEASINTVEYLSDGNSTWRAQLTDSRGSRRISFWDEGQPMTLEVVTKDGVSSELLFSQGGVYATFGERTWDLSKYTVEGKTAHGAARRSDQDFYPSDVIQAVIRYNVADPIGLALSGGHRPDRQVSDASTGIDPFMAAFCQSYPKVSTEDERQALEVDFRKKLQDTQLECTGEIKKISNSLDVNAGALQAQVSCGTTNFIFGEYRPREPEFAVLRIMGDGACMRFLIADMKPTAGGIYSCPGPFNAPLSGKILSMAPISCPSSS